MERYDIADEVSLEEPKITKSIRLVILRALIEGGADIYATDAILTRGAKASIYVGTVTEAAYMAGLQDIWWEALNEAKMGFDKEEYLRKQSSMRDIPFEEWKYYLQHIWLLFTRLSFLSVESDADSDKQVFDTSDEEDEETILVDDNDEDTDMFSVADSTESQKSVGSGCGDVKVVDPSKDMDILEPGINILAVGGPHGIDSLIPDVIFRLENGWTFSLYRDSRDRFVARPYVSADEILNSGRDELEPGWTCDTNVDTLSISEESLIPQRWVSLNAFSKIYLEDTIKNALKQMIEDSKNLSLMR
ncbi:hypothetical protein ABW20_dc0109062 [Dactylellina cionopaga]|nr:hypothetical protein ABW20_dc0109062 [Dactylellina cionopaga]